MHMEQSTLATTVQLQRGRHLSWHRPILAATPAGFSPFPHFRFVSFCTIDPAAPAQFLIRFILLCHVSCFHPEPEHAAHRWRLEPSSVDTKWSFWIRKKKKKIGTCCQSIFEDGGFEEGGKSVGDSGIDAVDSGHALLDAGGWQRFLHRRQRSQRHLSYGRTKRRCWRSRNASGRRGARKTAAQIGQVRFGTTAGCTRSGRMRNVDIGGIHQMGWEHGRWKQIVPVRMLLLLLQRVQRVPVQAHGRGRMERIIRRDFGRFFVIGIVDFDVLFVTFVQLMAALFRAQIR